MSSSGLAHPAVSEPESYAKEWRNHNTPLPQLHVWCRDCACDACAASVCQCVRARLKKSSLIITTCVLLTIDVSEQQTDNHKISIAVVTVSLMFWCGLQALTRTHTFRHNALQ